MGPIVESEQLSQKVLLFLHFPPIPLSLAKRFFANLKASERTGKKKVKKPMHVGINSWVWLRLRRLDIWVVLGGY